MRKIEIAVISFSAWLIVISYFMLMTGRFDLALFFILGFIGFLLIVDLIKPHFVRPSYMWYIRFLIFVGIVLFGAVIVQKIMEILG